MLMSQIFVESNNGYIGRISLKRKCFGNETYAIDTFDLPAFSYDIKKKKKKKRLYKVIVFFVYI